MHMHSYNFSDHVRDAGNAYLDTLLNLYLADMQIPAPITLSEFTSNLMQHE